MGNNAYRQLYAGDERFLIDADGHLTIEGTVRNIDNHQFDAEYSARNRTKDTFGIVSATIPGTVEMIGYGAFANCRALRQVVIEEGVRLLRDRAFDGCIALHSITLPESLKAVNGFAFHDSGLTEPVFSADGRILLYYPSKASAETYVVPDGVEEIAQAAFYGVLQLRRLVLPRSLRCIRTMAVYRCPALHVEMYASAEAERAAFCGSCRGGNITFLDEGLDALERAIRYSNLVGQPLLEQADYPLPERRSWTKDRVFISLAKRCASGDSAAMAQMCSWFASRAEAEPGVPFYAGARNFWAMRAWLCGRDDMRPRLNSWCEQRCSLPSAGLSEVLTGRLTGEQLCALGFFGYAPGRTYTVEGLQADGIVVVSAYFDEDGPDEDGYGREEYYDWWYMTPGLQMEAGVPWLHAFSLRDMRVYEESVRECRERAVQRLRESGWGQH